MKIYRILTFLLFLAVAGVACNRSTGEKTQDGNNKPQTEINKENDQKLEGDHVQSPDELPVLTPEQRKNYLDKSKQIAQTAFKIFSGHLKNYFEKKDPAQALEYCHKNALKITDSLANAYGVKLKRTSYRLRNPKNKPTPQEEKVMEIYRKQILKNLKPQPYLHYDNEGYPHVYIPIMVQAKCLMCHGDPNKDIPEMINNKLSELYPSDKAIFFKEGDLRGIWSIRFPKTGKQK